MLPLYELEDSDFCLPLQRIKIIYMHTIDIEHEIILEHSYNSFIISFFLGLYTRKKLLKKVKHIQ